MADTSTAGDEDDRPATVEESRTHLCEYGQQRLAESRVMAAWAVSEQAKLANEWRVLTEHLRLNADDDARLALCILNRLWSDAWRHQDFAMKMGQLAHVNEPRRGPSSRYTWGELADYDGRPQDLLNDAANLERHLLAWITNAARSRGVLPPGDDFDRAGDKLRQFAMLIEDRTRENRQPPEPTATTTDPPLTVPPILPPATPPEPGKLNVNRAAHAIALLASEPRPSMIEIAAAVGVRREHLYTKAEFDRFRTIARNLGVMNPKSTPDNVAEGYVDEDGNVDGTRDKQPARPTRRGKRSVD